MRSNAYDDITGFHVQTKKYEYLENETLFFLHIKEIIHYRLKEL